MTQYLGQDTTKRVRKMTSARLMLILFVLLTSATADAQTVSGTSPTCGPVNGKTRKDMENVLAFCSRAIPRNSGVETAYAMQSILWVQVTRPTANAMRLDKLTTENLVKKWMGLWKTLSGMKAVTVHVRWDEVEIATGDTSVFRGDQVTVK